MRGPFSTQEKYFRLLIVESLISQNILCTHDLTKYPHDAEYFSLFKVGLLSMRLGYISPKKSKIEFLTLPLIGIVLSSLFLKVPVFAASPSLEGTWSGGGFVVFAGGAKESARCRANFKKRGADSYFVSARCASASGKVDQTATLTYVGGSRFSGSFYNSEFNIDGTFTVTVSGSTQNVYITSPTGSSATLKLSR